MLEGGGAAGGLLAANSELAHVVLGAVLGGEGWEGDSKEYVEGVEELLALSRAMQCMNVHSRIASGEHMHYEDESWQNAFQVRSHARTHTLTHASTYTHIHTLIASGKHMQYENESWQHTFQVRSHTCTRIHAHTYMHIHARIARGEHVHYKDVSWQHVF